MSFLLQVSTKRFFKNGSCYQLSVLSGSNFKKIVDEIIGVHDAIRYVVVVSDRGKMLYNQVKEGKKPYTSEKETEVLSSDLSVIQTMHALYDNSLGRISCMLMIRERLYQLVYYVDNLIFYVTCDRVIDSIKATEVKNKVESIIKKSIQ